MPFTKKICACLNNNLPAITLITVAGWFVAQALVLLLFNSTPQITDGAAFESLALQCYENGTFYPDRSQIYTSFIYQPGCVNYLLMHLHLFGSFRLVSLCNMFLNLLIVCEIYYLTRYFFGRRAACWAVILCCLMVFSFTLNIPLHLSEIPFLALSLTAICLILNRKTHTLLLAGIFLAVANYIRPFGWIFLVTALFWLISKKAGWRSTALFVASFLLSLSAIGYVNKLQSDHFIFQATTGSFNLVQGANEKMMTGGYVDPYYLELLNAEDEGRLTFLQTDSVCRSKALDFIVHHPLKYLAYMPVKLFRLWAVDTYDTQVMRSLCKGGLWLGFRFSRYPQPDVGTYHGTLWGWCGEIFKRIILNAGYYLAISCFLFYTVSKRKRLNSNDIFLFLPLLLGSIVSMLTVGFQRYHYPLLPFMIAFAAAYIAQRMNKETENAKISPEKS